ncbi:MAG: hypothetical protein ACJ72W_18210 [Actinoallomurus sp.]
MTRSRDHVTPRWGRRSASGPACTRRCHVAHRGRWSAGGDVIRWGRGSAPSPARDDVLGFLLPAFRQLPGERLDGVGEQGDVGFESADALLDQANRWLRQPPGDLP